MGSVGNCFDSDDTLSLKTASEDGDYVFVDAMENFHVEFKEKKVRTQSFLDEHFGAYAQYFKIINEGITKMFTKL